MDGNFPKTIDDVMPDRADLDCVRIAISPALLAGTLKAIAAMVDIESKGCTLNISMNDNGAAHPVVLSARGADGRDIRGAIMPIQPAEPRDDARKLYGLLREFATDVLTTGHYSGDDHYNRETINTLKSMLGVAIPDSDDGGSDDE